MTWPSSPIITIFSRSVKARRDNLNTIREQQEEDRARDRLSADRRNKP
jgi:hypothetical protein